MSGFLFDLSFKAIFIFLGVLLHFQSVKAEPKEKKTYYFYDAHAVRYELYQTNGKKPYNWLFLPGGPGADSSYLRELVDILQLPGNVWLIDMPGVGSNARDFQNFEAWFAIFPHIIERFDNAILVGHSFGGMFPLLFPELENILKGLVILNSSPMLWMEATAEYAKQFHLPDLTRPMQEFTLYPSPQTFKVALDACAPYYFSPQSLEKGRQWLSHIPCTYLPAVWWLNKAVEISFTAQWIPQKIPTFIVGSKYDCICPFTLFEKDERFQRPNIQLFFIKDAGHFVWRENPSAIKQIFKKVLSKL